MLGHKPSKCVVSALKASLVTCLADFKRHEHRHGDAVQACGKQEGEEADVFSTERLEGELDFGKSHRAIPHIEIEIMRLEECCIMSGAHK